MDKFSENTLVSILSATWESKMSAYLYTMTVAGNYGTPYLTNIIL